jgi:hypothetical protein
MATLALTLDQKMETLRGKICELYSIVAELQLLFPGLKFTPDGRMVGDIGEAIGETYYGIDRFRCGNPGTDGAVCGREVQIKTTQGLDVSVKKPKSGDLLLVIKLASDGTWQEKYNGDSERVWKALERQKETRAGEKAISLRRLQLLQAEVEENDRILPKNASVSISAAVGGPYFPKCNI